MDARPVDADVLIAGGGPAGSAAAIVCARAGLQVILCEGEPTVTDRPGETLHPGAEVLLAQLGVELASVTGARFPGIFVEWGGPRHFEPFGADAKGLWSGFQVWRADFDTLLRDTARRTGADVRTGCRARTAAPVDEGWRVETSQGPLNVHMLVDATGRWRWLERVLGTGGTVHSRRLVARYGYAKGELPERDGAPLLVGDAAGWTWTARVRPNLYHWTRVAFDAAPVATTWTPIEFVMLQPTAPARGADVTWRLANGIAGDSWYRVGDAAANLDPTSSHGVLRALLTGAMAGHLISSVLRRNAPAPGAAAAYSDWLVRGFEADAAAMRKLYKTARAN